MNSRTFSLVLSSFCTLAVLQTGCAIDTANQSEETIGTLKMPLTATSTSGATYRLRNATLKVSGTESATVMSEDYLDAGSFDVELAAGNYLIKLNDGWTLERLVDGVAEPVDAVLTSDNPIPFAISDQQLTFVNFVFRAGDDVIQLGNGKLVVGVIVDDGPGGGGTEDTIEACQDGVDNDGDGFIDCGDFDCRGISPEVCGGEPEDNLTACSDGVDNDFDGFVDCDDFDCSLNFPSICGAPSGTENEPQSCRDGVDNEGDGFIDCSDFDCRGVIPECPAENTPAACTDGVDNDGDGFVDCIDFDCTGVVPACQ